jgi:hypothetical protein
MCNRYSTINIRNKYPLGIYIKYVIHYLDYTYFKPSALNVPTLERYKSVEICLISPPAILTTIVLELESFPEYLHTQFYLTENKL